MESVDRLIALSVDERLVAADGKMRSAVCRGGDIETEYRAACPHVSFTCVKIVLAAEQIL